MSIKKTQSIDWLGIEKDTDRVRLTIVDDLDWLDEQQHLLLLQEKLNSYLAFIESGEVFEALKEHAGRQVDERTPVDVHILARYQVSHSGEQFLAYATSVFSGAGIQLYFEVVEIPAA